LGIRCRHSVLSSGSRIEDTDSIFPRQVLSSPGFQEC
jgi:hypothetical protein